MTKRLFVAIIITIGLILFANRAAFADVYYYQCTNNEWTPKQQSTYEEFHNWTDDNKGSYKMTFDNAGAVAVYRPDNSEYWRLIKEDAWQWLAEHPLPSNKKFANFNLFLEKNKPYHPNASELQ